ADDAARSDAGDFATVGKREPEVAVFAHRDRERLAAFTDPEGFARVRLRGSGARRESERGKSADKLEMKLAPREDEGGNGGLDEVKTRYHKGNNFRAYLQRAKRNWLRRCNF